MQHAEREQSQAVDVLLGTGVPYRLHHVGIALPTRRAAARAQRSLGLTVEWVNELPEHACVCYYCAGPGLNVELVVPLHAGSSTAKLPGGVHHLGVQVDDLDKAWHLLETDGYRFVDDAPLEVVGRYRIAFVQPLRLGFLLELVEDREAAP